MKVQLFRVSAQAYLLPTAKITYDKWLNGYYELQFIWFNRGVSFMLGKEDEYNKF